MTEDKPKITMKPLVVRYDHAPAIVGIKPSTIDALEHQGEFPRRRKLSGRSVGYLMRELEEWAESRPVSDLLPVAARKVVA